MQLTWGRVGGKPLYAEYQINIGNTNNRPGDVTFELRIAHQLQLRNVPKYLTIMAPYWI